MYGISVCAFTYVGGGGLFSFFREDTVQASRDLLKNHIMELYEIPLLRFMTNGSGEKEKIIEMLDKSVG